MEKFLRFWLPPFLWAFVIFSFSAFPTGSTSPVYWQDFVAKKLAHITEYAVLAVLLYRAYKGYSWSKKRALAFTIATILVYAFSDEFHQSFTPTRQPKITDVGFDTIGASIGLWTVIYLLPKMPKRLTNLAENLDLLSKEEK